VTEGSYATPNLDFNYGLGDRIQLKFELPLMIQESRASQEPGGNRPHFAAGLGNSLIGVKWRFYETRAETKQHGQRPATRFSFGMSIYPQLLENNHTGSVRRGIAEPGPQFLLPIEANASLGPIQMVGETGYWFTPKGAANSLPNLWIRGLLVGHEFSNKTELYLELHDDQEVEGLARESTIGIGGRQPIARKGRTLFLGMFGRSLGGVTSTNGQPNWIAYFGLQFRLGPDKQP
jgi:hypothetical protein